MVPRPQGQRPIFEGEKLLSVTQSPRCPPFCGKITISIPSVTTRLLVEVNTMIELLLTLVLSIGYGY